MTSYCTPLPHQAVRRKARESSEGRLVNHTSDGSERRWQIVNSITLQYVKEIAE